MYSCVKNEHICMLILKDSYILEASADKCTVQLTLVHTERMFPIGCSCKVSLQYHGYIPLQPSHHICPMDLQSIRPDLMHNISQCAFSNLKKEKHDNVAHQFKFNFEGVRLKENRRHSYAQTLQMLSYQILHCEYSCPLEEN